MPSTAIDYARALNAAQYQTVTHTTGPHLVIAGAGTGKTRTLVHRVAYLVEQGIAPESILLLTFTKKSAQEMMHRASQILDARCARVSGGTFHSFANLTLRKFAKYLGYSANFTIIDRADAEDLLGSIRKELGFAKEKGQFPRKEALLNILSKSVNTGREYRDILNEDYQQFVGEELNIEKVAIRYADYKQSVSLMDYDDLLVNLKRLMEENAPIRRMLSERYAFIMVDEYQDTNQLQAKIIRLLASEHQNIMVVGDDAQSIYAFRGANFRNIMDFPKLFPGCIVTTLEQNYRSVQPILSLTNAIIANAEEKFTKELFSEIDGPDKPYFLKPKGPFEQARFVALEIDKLRKAGTPLGEIAVLFRSGWHSNELEVELAKSGIPFVKFGGIKLVEAAHIKDALAFLRVVFNPTDTVAWRRILLLNEGIGEVTAGKIVDTLLEVGKGFEGLLDPQFAKKKYAGVLGELHGLFARVAGLEGSPAEAVNVVLNYYYPFFQKAYDDYERRWNDLKSLTQIAERSEDLERFLTDMSLEPPEQKQFAPEDRDTPKLVLSTIHSAKGLEWETVFILHLVDGCLPSSRSFARDESIEEERRLFYVAATRAKKRLYLLAPRLESTSFYQDFGGPSRFLYEIEDLDDLTDRWQQKVKARPR